MPHLIAILARLIRPCFRAAPFTPDPLSSALVLPIAIRSGGGSSCVEGEPHDRGFQHGRLMATRSRICQILARQQSVKALNDG